MERKTGYLRFSILELLSVVGVIAFAIVSLNRADPLFETLFFSFTLLVILAALLLALGRRAGARVFWIGFTATSSVYLVFAHMPDSDETVPRHNGPEITTQILRLTYNLLHSDTYGTNFSPQPGGFFSVQDDLFDSRDFEDPFGEDTGESDVASLEPFPANFSLIYGSGQRIVSSGDSMSFMRIGHSAWALLFGWFAGHFTRVVYERSRCQPTQKR